MCTVGKNNVASRKLENMAQKLTFLDIDSAQEWDKKLTQLLQHQPYINILELTLANIEDIMPLLSIQLIFILCIQYSTAQNLREKS